MSLCCWTPGLQGSRFVPFFSLAYFFVLMGYIFLRRDMWSVNILRTCMPTDASFYSQNVRDSWAGYRLLARNRPLSKEYPYLIASAVTIQKSNAILILDSSWRPHFFLEAFKIFSLGFWTFVTMCFLVRAGFFVCAVFFSIWHFTCSFNLKVHICQF